jgi:hypothetical protein
MSRRNGIVCQHDSIHFLCGKARVAPTQSSNIMPDANGLSKRKCGRCEQHVLEQACTSIEVGACKLLRRSERMKFIALSMRSSSTEPGTMTKAGSYMRRNSEHASANAGTRSTDTTPFKLCTSGSTTVAAQMNHHPPHPLLAAPAHAQNLQAKAGVARVGAC